MKPILLSILFVLGIFLAHCDSDDCNGVALSCLEPDVNEMTQLRIDLSRFSPEEIAATQLVRIDRFNEDIVDTLKLNTFDQFDDEIILGMNSTISLTRSLDNDDEVPDLNFKVLIGSPVQTFDITDIRVTYRTEPCSCPDVLLESLRFDGELVEINSFSHVIRL